MKPFYTNYDVIHYLKNFRVKDQRESSAYICHTEQYMRPQCYIESSYSTVHGLKQIGHMTPDLKIDAARTIQWRRNALEPKGKALQKFSIYA